MIQPDLPLAELHRHLDGAVRLTLTHARNRALAAETRILEVQQQSREAQAQLEREGALRQRRLGSLGTVDSTSSVDVETETHIQDALAQRKIIPVKVGTLRDVEHADSLGKSAHGDRAFQDHRRGKRILVSACG